MGLKKWLGLIALSVLLMPFFGLGFFVIPAYVGWKYVKLCLKVDIFIAYMIIRIPIWIFIQLPLWYLGKGAQQANRFFQRGLDVYRQRPKTAALITIPSFLLMLFFFPLNFSREASVEALMGNLIPFFFIILGTFILSFILVKIYNFFSSAQIARRRAPEGMKAPARKAGAAKEKAEAAADKAGKGAAKAAGAAAGGAAMYRDIKISENIGGQRGEAKLGQVPSDIKSQVAAVAEDLPFLEDYVTSAGGGALTAEGEAAAASAASTATIGLGVVMVVLLVAVFIVFVQAVVFTFFFLAWLKAVLPMLVGPMMGAIGLGAAYGDWIGGTIGNQYVAGVGEEFEEVGHMYGQAKARVFCLLKGPACLRQWRMNNTVRPGSNDVGETYGLKIDRFQVGQGDSVDIAFKEPGYALPISFTISNPRHGLKGITAGNVSYRVKVIDMERGVEDPYCDTGWVPVGAGEATAYDADGDKERDDIYPGTSASTGFLTLDSSTPQIKDPITLKSCEMLQPGLGSHRTVMLQISYDYFSQATLYFDAMSRETLSSDPSINKDWKESQTADTPVKAAINVNSPVLFYMEGGDRKPQPFAVRATLNTEKSDLKYKVKDLKVRKSSLTDISGSGSNCQFKSPNNNMMGLKPGAEEDIIAGTGSRPDKYYWFSRSKKPPIFGCVMQLKDSEIDSISETGETLNMDVQSRYTVAKEDRLGSFKALNTRCSDAKFNCPILVTENFNHTDAGDVNFKTTCKGIDAGNGCTIYKFSSPASWETEWKTLNGNTVGIDSNEIALDISEDLGSVDYDPNQPIGLDRHDWAKIDTNGNGYKDNGDEPLYGFAIIEHKPIGGEKDWKYIRLRHKLVKNNCAFNDDASKSEFKAEWINKTEQSYDNLKVIEFRPQYGECNQNIIDKFNSWLSGNSCDGAVVLRGGSPTCFDY